MPDTSAPAKPSGIRVHASGLVATSLGATAAQRRTTVVFLLAVLVLGGIGVWGYTTIDRSLKQSTANHLSTLLKTSEAGLRLWLDEQLRVAKAVADSDSLPPALSTLREVAHARDPHQRLASSPAQQVARDELTLVAEGLGFSGFAVTDETGIVLIASDKSLIGFQAAEEPDLYPAWVQTGKCRTRLGFRSRLMEQQLGKGKAPPISVFSCPVADRAKHYIGAVHLISPPQAQFSEILRMARSGETGETYAFNAKAQMISNSRFMEQLRSTGLLSAEQKSSILAVELRNPGVNLLEEKRPAAGAELPLTAMASEATKKRSGVNVEGYLDYRGVPVLGAWSWLEEYDFGIATEQDVAEAFSLKRTLHDAFWGLFAVLGVVVFTLVLSSHMLARLRSRSEAAERQVRQLGRYNLEHKLGEGGMGEVFKATHTLLRRPTAIKLMKGGGDSDAALERFKREVQLTSQLTHPNTIAIYDYGHTPEGVFYYAMELLQGINLQDLVERHGAMPAARVIHVVLQICGALNEAHHKGLIHRDIKPPNVFLCERGGIYDTVKVLDFGLVKSLNSAPEDSKLTAVGSIVGTPHFMAPEIVKDAMQASERSDIYAVGALAYFLLSGDFMFEGDTPMDVCVAQLTQTPASLRKFSSIPHDLADVVMACLEKHPDDRPESVQSLAQRLEACEAFGGWSTRDAESWWLEHERALTSEASTAFAATLATDAEQLG